MYQGDCRISQTGRFWWPLFGSNFRTISVIFGQNQLYQKQITFFGNKMSKKFCNYLWQFSYTKETLSPQANLKLWKISLFMYVDNQGWKSDGHWRWSFHQQLASTCRLHILCLSHDLWNCGKSSCSIGSGKWVHSTFHNGCLEHSDRFITPCVFHNWLVLLHILVLWSWRWPGQNSAMAWHHHLTVHHAVPTSHRKMVWKEESILWWRCLGWCLVVRGNFVCLDVPFQHGGKEKCTVKSSRA